PFHIELNCHLRLFGWEQVCIVIRDINAFVSYTVRDGRSREPHINQKRNGTMANVMNSNSWYTGFLRPPIHLPMKITFCDREHSIGWFNSIEHLDIVLDFLNEKL